MEILSERLMSNPDATSEGQTAAIAAAVSEVVTKSVSDMVEMQLRAHRDVMQASLEAQIKAMRSELLEALAQRPPANPLPRTSMHRAAPQAQEGKLMRWGDDALAAPQRDAPGGDESDGEVGMQVDTQSMKIEKEEKLAHDKAVKQREHFMQKNSADELFGVDLGSLKRPTGVRRSSDVMTIVRRRPRKAPHARATKAPPRRHQGVAADCCRPTDADCSSRVLCRSRRSEGASMSS